METSNSNTFASNLAPRSVPDVDVVGSDGVSREGASVSGLNRSSVGLSAGTSTATATVVVTTQQQQHHQPEHNTNDDVPILRLSLRPRSHVTWDERVVNNEGMGRKSSKRCCIFHKQRAFGESSTESSGEEDDDGSTSSSSSGGWGSGSARPMARKKNKGKSKMGVVKNKPNIPDYQRFHA